MPKHGVCRQLKNTPCSAATATNNLRNRVHYHGAHSSQLMPCLYFFIRTYFNVGNTEETFKKNGRGRGRNFPSGEYTVVWRILRLGWDLSWLRFQACSTGNVGYYSRYKSGRLDTDRTQMVRQRKEHWLGTRCYWRCSCAGISVPMPRQDSSCSNAVSSKAPDLPLPQQQQQPSNHASNRHTHPLGSFDAGPR